MMDWRAEIRRRLASAGLEPTRENEIVEEIVQHLEDRHADLLARGTDPDEADAAVLAELDAEDVLPRRLRGAAPKAQHPPVLGASRGSVLADLWNDARYAVRALRKSPGFTAVTLLSLALGIGANTAIFQMLDTLHLRALPVDNPQDLGIVRITNSKWRSGRTSGSHPHVTHQVWERIRDRQEGFSGVVAWGDGTVNLAPSGVARWARALMVSGNYFDVLGVRPLHGRTFTPEDDRRGCTDPGAVVSHGFWQRELGADPSAIGRKLSLERHSVTVIGVTPPSFFGLEVGRSFDVAVPLCLEKTLYGEQSLLDLPYGWWMSVVGRLKPGWSIERASAQLDSISKGIFEDTVPPTYGPDSVDKYKQYRLGVFPAGTGISQIRDEYSKPLYFLLAIAAMVLLIACANLANLLLARASAREREISVRLALGASRGRLIRQLMGESLLIAFVGAALGLVVARLLTEFLIAFLSTPDRELFVNLAPDWRVLAFTAAVATLTCLLFGLAPALRASRTDVGSVLKATQSTTASRQRFGLRRLLVAVQVALSFVLLFGALLFVRSLRNLTTMDPGFRDENVVIVSVEQGSMELPKERRVPFVRDLLERVRATPGVEAAAAANIVPISGNGWNDLVWLDGGDRSRTAEVKFDQVSAGYFHTLGAPLLAGRDFGDADTLQSPKVAIVNQQFARKLAGGDASVVGRRFHVIAGPADSNNDQVYEIVGVVGDMKYRSLREEFQATAFLPMGQEAEPPPYANLLIRTNLPPAAVVGALKQAITDFEPRLILDFDVLTRMIAQSVLLERLMATLAGFFGALASLLAVIGLYGVVSYSVARRVHEIGIRMALGADSRKVLRMIVREAVGLLVVGLVAGVGLALVGARAAGALLYGLAPHDPATVAMAVGVMATVTILASLLPARRAARVDPMVALREE